MKPNIITIVAAIVDKTSLTLYKEDGSTLVIPQGDPRVRKIVSEAMPLLVTNGKAEVDIASENDINHYAEFEKQTNGFVRFFRVTKEKVAKFFNPEPEEQVKHSLDVKNEAELIQKTIESNERAINEILDQAIPASSEHFYEVGLDTQTAIISDVEDGTTSGRHEAGLSDETMIAVVGNQVVPGVEKIKNQFARANAMGSPEGVKRFIERLCAVIDKRSHSVDDLLKFMERADLPIADDGSIVIYKILAKSDRHYIDCHSRKIEQWPGAYVCMAENMVDPNRRNECSNGLHVARRGYLGSFAGDVCTICKLAPEDVIAVPEYDANKMRVCGYHILSTLPEEVFRLLKSNRPMSDSPEGAKILAQVLRGNHQGITHRIEIINNETKETRVTSYGVLQTPEPVVEVEPATALADTPELVDEPIDPTAVNKTFVKISRREEASKLMDEYQQNPTEETLTALWVLKRTAKVSWEKLGIDEPLPVEKMLTKQKKPQNGAPVASKATHRETIMAMLPITTKEQAEAVLAIKRRCKKSWVDLGISVGDLEDIMNLTQDK